MSEGGEPLKKRARTEDGLCIAAVVSKPHPPAPLLRVKSASLTPKSASSTPSSKSSSPLTPFPASPASSVASSSKSQGAFTTAASPVITKPMSVPVVPTTQSRAVRWSELLASAFMEAHKEQVQPEDVDQVKELMLRTAEAIPGDADAAMLRFRTLKFAMLDSKNGKLRSDILDGTLAPEVLATLREQDLANPEQRKKREEEFLERNKSKDLNELAKALSSTSTLFPCPRCGARDCTWVQRQTRSGDEPMTVCCTCNKCGRVWRKY